MATKEQLSALMDGDLSDVEVLSELGMDPALQDTWSRYHLIGDGRRCHNRTGPGIRLL
jgi:sigma-E factor negative regulatory protein RseA